MKLRNLFFASLAMVTFAACSNDDEPGIENNEPQDASLFVNVTTSTGPISKAGTETGSVTNVNESKINDLKLYVYSGQDYFTEFTIISNGKAGEGVASATNEYDTKEPAYSFKLAGLKTATPYTLVAIANPHFNADENINLRTSKLNAVLAAAQTYDAQFAGNSETASDNGSFTMVGITSIADDELAADPATTNTAKINISRRLAAVQISEITMNLSDDAGENFKNATVKLNGIALINVRSTTKTGTMAQAGTKDTPHTTGVDATLENASALIHGNVWDKTATPNTNLKQEYTGNNFALGGAKANKAITIDETSGIYNRLYAFPTTDNNLIFKLKLTYKNTTLDTEEIRYYNIHLANNKIQNNTLYTLKATITGVGSKDPDVVEETAGDITTTLNVLPWQVATVQNEGDLKD